MAAAGLLALMDDIATVLDDISVLVKISAKKTSGLVTDDLVVTAEQVAGITTKREIPIIMDVAQGSLINKAILIPAALAINFFMPFLITPLLLIGAAYLCYEGTEKIMHSIAHRKSYEADDAQDDAVQVVNLETQIEEKLTKQQTQKIKGAIRTDFILSAEIIIIALGVVAEASLTTQITTLIVIGLLMTIVVYGAVMLLVKLDDFGFFLMRKAGDAKRLLHKIGRSFVNLSVKMMTWLSIIGTAAMLLVGGEIAIHKISLFEHLLHGPLDYQPQIPFIGALIGAALPLLINMFVGLIYGSIIIMIMFLVNQIRNRYVASK